MQFHPIGIIEVLHKDSRFVSRLLTTGYLVKSIKPTT